MPVGVDEAGPERDAGLLERASAGADDELPAGLQPAAEPGSAVFTPHEPEPGEPPEQVPAEQSLRQHRRLLADRHVDRRVALSSSAICRPELPPPTTSTGPSGRASGLRYSALCSWVTDGVQPLGRRRHEGDLERPGRHDHLPGAEDVIAGADLELVADPVVAR